MAVGYKRQTDGRCEIFAPLLLVLSSPRMSSVSELKVALNVTKDALAITDEVLGTSKASLQKLQRAVEELELADAAKEEIAEKRAEFEAARVDVEHLEERRRVGFGCVLEAKRAVQAKEREEAEEAAAAAAAEAEAEAEAARLKAEAEGDGDEGEDEQDERGDERSDERSDAPASEEDVEDELPPPELKDAVGPANFVQVRGRMCEADADRMSSVRGARGARADAAGAATGLVASFSPSAGTATTTRRPVGSRPRPRRRTRRSGRR